MSKIRSKNTKLELVFMKLLSAKLYPMGYRYRKHYRAVCGNPDVAFVKQKIAIFVDSEFWHGYQFRKNKKDLKTDYWLKKIRRNMARDKEVNSQLRKSGWKVLRFWENEIKDKPDYALSVVSNAL